MLRVICSGFHAVPVACRRLSAACSTTTSRHLTGPSLNHYELTGEQKEMQRMAQDFAKTELQPHGARWDQAEEFPRTTLRKAAELGFGGVYVTEDVGGTGLCRMDGAVIFESLAYGDVPVAAYLTIHNMVASVIDRFASDKLRQQHLPALATMDKLASYCLTEPGSGSDAASLKATAKRDGNAYILNGSKAFISGGGSSELYLVMARTGPQEAGAKGISALLVEKGMPGLSFGKPEEKLGWRCQPTCSVSFDNVVVPAENLVGQEGDGFKIAMAALDGGRINIAACSVGGAQFCLDYARRYVQERQQFGQPLGSFQTIEFRIADMATTLHASRLLVHRAAQALDAKAPTATLDAAMAKRFATDSCFQVADGCLQLLGGYGYLRDHPLERYLRDLRVHSILEGTNEVMRLIISRQLQKVHPV